MEDVNDGELRRETLRKMDAEIAKLIAETVRINRATDPEVAELVAETVRIIREPIWYPMLIAAGLMAAGAALFGGLAMLLLRLMGGPA
jgi:hypothetical protein